MSGYTKNNSNSNNENNDHTFNINIDGTEPNLSEEDEITVNLEEDTYHIKDSDLGIISVETYDLGYEHTETIFSANNQSSPEKAPTITHEKFTRQILPYEADTAKTINTLTDIQKDTQNVKIVFDLSAEDLDNFFEENTVLFHILRIFTFIPDKNGNNDEDKDKEIVNFNPTPKMIYLLTVSKEVFGLKANTAYLMDAGKIITNNNDLKNVENLPAEILFENNLANIILNMDKENAENAENDKENFKKIVKDIVFDKFVADYVKKIIDKPIDNITKNAEEKASEIQEQATKFIDDVINQSINNMIKKYIHKLKNTKKINENVKKIIDDINLDNIINNVVAQIRENLDSSDDDKNGTNVDLANYHFLNIHNEPKYQSKFMKLLREAIEENKKQYKEIKKIENDNANFGIGPFDPTNAVDPIKGGTNNKPKIPPSQTQKKPPPKTTNNTIKKPKQPASNNLPNTQLQQIASIPEEEKHIIRVINTTEIIKNRIRTNPFVEILAEQANIYNTQPTYKVYIPINKNGETKTVSKPTEHYEGKQDLNNISFGLISQSGIIRLSQNSNDIQSTLSGLEKGPKIYSSSFQIIDNRHNLIDVGIPKASTIDISVLEYYFSLITLNNSNYGTIVAKYLKHDNNRWDTLMYLILLCLNMEKVNTSEYRNMVKSHAEKIFLPDTTANDIRILINNKIYGEPIKNDRNKINELLKKLQ